jgi:hypothetical protein
MSILLGKSAGDQVSLWLPAMLRYRSRMMLLEPELFEQSIFAMMLDFWGWGRN